MKPVKKSATTKIASATKKKKATKGHVAATKRGAKITRKTKQGKPSQASTPHVPAGPQEETTSGPLTLAFGCLRERPEVIDPRMRAIKLHSTMKKHNTRKNKTDSDIQKATVAPDPLDPAAQFIVERADLCEKLLTDPGFTMFDKTISSQELDDILRVLASLPFEFRREGLRQYKKGIRYFGKVPFEVERSPADCVSPEDAKRLFRHISCPEGPGEGRQFGLAWLNGLDLEVLQPWHNHQQAYDADHELRRVLQVIGLELEMDLLLSNDTDNAPDYIDKYAAKPGLRESQREYLKQLAEKIRGFDRLDPEARTIAKNAFACGILYCTKARYPECGVLEADRWFAKESTWQWIIIFAQLRHGPTLGRTELLKALGCTNPQEYSKTSGNLAAFHPEYSRHTPPISFSSFNKAFTSARKWLKDHDGADAPAPQSIIEENVLSVITQQKKSADQRRRNQKLKVDAEFGRRARAEQNAVKYKPLAEAAISHQAKKTAEEENVKAAAQKKKWSKATDHIP